MEKQPSDLRQSCAQPSICSETVALSGHTSQQYPSRIPRLAIQFLYKCVRESTLTQWLEHWIFTHAARVRISPMAGIFSAMLYKFPMAFCHRMEACLGLFFIQFQVA